MQVLREFVHTCLMSFPRSMFRICSFLRVTSCWAEFMKAAFGNSHLHRLLTKDRLTLAFDDSPRCQSVPLFGDMHAFGRQQRFAVRTYLKLSCREHGVRCSRAFVPTAPGSLPGCRLCWCCCMAPPTPRSAVRPLMRRALHRTLGLHLASVTTAFGSC